MTLSLFTWGRAAGAGVQAASWGRYTAFLAHHRSGAWTVDLYHGTKRTRHEELDASITPTDARTTAEQFLLDEQGPEVRELVRRARAAQMAGAGTRSLRAVGGSGGKRRKAMGAKKKAKRRSAGGKRRGLPSTTLFYARQDPKGRWKHLMAISDGRLVLFEMEPAIIAGWNCKRTTVQSGDDWDGMSAASIVAFKQQSGDNLLRPAVEGEVEWMQSKLAAPGGKKRHAGGKRRSAPRRTKHPRSHPHPAPRPGLAAVVADINRLVK